MVGCGVTILIGGLAALAISALTVCVNDSVCSMQDGFTLMVGWLATLFGALMLLGAWGERRSRR